MNNVTAPQPTFHGHLTPALRAAAPTPTPSPEHTVMVGVQYPWGYGWRTVRTSRMGDFLDRLGEDEQVTMVSHAYLCPCE